MCHGLRMEVREQLVRVNPFLPTREPWGFNSGSQDWQQEPQPCGQPMGYVLDFSNILNLAGNVAGGRLLAQHAPCLQVYL